MTEKIKIEKTKSGLPAIWECGGGYSNTGEATIIASPSGDAKRAIYVRGRGKLANGNHALIVLEIGDHIVEASHHRVDFKMDIYKILQFEANDENTYAVTELVYQFSRGEWDKEPPAYLTPAVEAAMGKATCYHCRSAHYILE